MLSRDPSADPWRQKVWRTNLAQAEKRQEQSWFLVCFCLRSHCGSEVRHSACPSLSSEPHLIFSPFGSRASGAKLGIRPAHRLLHFEHRAQSFILSSSFSHVRGEKRRVSSVNRNVRRSKGARAFGKLGAMLKRSPRAVEPRNVRVALQSNYAFKRTAGILHGVS